MIGGRLLAAALALALAVPAAAQDRSSERFERRRVEPGETVSRTLDCSGGQVTGGGYQIYGQPDDAAPFVVRADMPTGGNGWRVDIQNVSEGILPLVFRIYVICQ